MTFLPPSLDMSNRDFDSLRGRLIELARSVFPAWTDFEVATFGTTLLELFAHVGDVVSYNQDNQARESRLSTATLRKNVIASARLLGYRPHGAVAATADVTFGLERVPTADVTLAAGTIVRTPEVIDPVVFRLLLPVTIRAGQSSPEAVGTVEHAEVHEERIGTRGLPNLEVMLERAPYLDRSLTIETALGTYVEVESFLGSGPTDRHMAVLVDQTERATVRFGDGRLGLPPQGTAVLRYKTGGGRRGNVAPGTITVVEGAVTDAHGRPVQVRVINPAKGSGGVDRESIAQAKLLAPANLRATSRSVCDDDFVAHALKVPGVARALMLTSNHDAAIPENSGDLVIVPAGGGTPTQVLLDEVLHQVTVVYPCTLTFQVRVLTAIYRPVHVTTRIHLRPGARATDVGDAIRQRLVARFALTDGRGAPNPAVDFGGALRAEGDLVGSLAWSDIADLVIDVPGVRKLADGPSGLLLNGAAADVALLTREFPVLGTVQIVRADTGASL